MWSTEGSLFAFGWLPDKKPISYFTFIVLVLLAFKEKENEILEMYGKSELKLRKIKCDYEIAIHKGLAMFTVHSQRVLLPLQSSHLEESNDVWSLCCLHAGQTV